MSMSLGREKKHLSGIENMELSGSLTPKGRTSPTGAKPVLGSVV
jgi:hypothetical protein